MKLKPLTALAALTLSVSASAETYQCQYSEYYSTPQIFEITATTRSYTRSNDSFLLRGDGIDPDKTITVPIVRETPTAIFLLEDFQHLPAPKWPEDTGSFSLRVIDKQSLTFIWVSERFTEEEHGHRQRGRCLLISDKGES